MPPGGIYSHVTIPTLIPSCYLDLERNSLCMLQQHNVTPTTGSSTFAATFELCACTFSREYAPFLACRLRLNYVLALFLEKTIPFLHVGCQWSLASYTRLTLLNTSTKPARISSYLNAPTSLHVRCQWSLASDQAHIVEHIHHARTDLLRNRIKYV
jgi:hypothetical protein